MDTITNELQFDESHHYCYEDTACMSKSDEENFSKRFNEACRKLGYDQMPQVNLGKLIGTSGPNIYYYRNGQRLPSMAMAIKISDFLKVNLNWLMTGKGRMDETATLEEVWMSFPEEERTAFLANLASRHKK